MAWPATGTASAPEGAGQLRAVQGALPPQYAFNLFQRPLAQRLGQAQLLISALGRADSAGSAYRELPAQVFRRDQVQRTAQGPAEHDGALDFARMDDIRLT